MYRVRKRNQFDHVPGTIVRGKRFGHDTSVPTGRGAYFVCTVRQGVEDATKKWSTTLIRWGYACPWYGEFLKLDTDPLYARLKFLLAHGLTIASLGLNQLGAMSDAQRERLAEFLTEHDLQAFPRVGFRYLEAGEDEAKCKTDQIVEALHRYRFLLQGAIVATEAGAGNRFERTLPLDEKLARLSTRLAPLAAACNELGTPLGIENHGDYYVSDLVALCQQTPHLYLFLDTGNTYLIGEQPLPAFELAAPYTVGTHFKDHRVRPRPEARPLHFEVGPSALGDGDVPLRACYKLLMQHAPFPERLVMELEMICPDDMRPLDCLERSLTFVRSLQE